MYVLMYIEKSQESVSLFRKIERKRWRERERGAHALYLYIHRLGLLVHVLQSFKYQITSKYFISLFSFFAVALISQQVSSSGSCGGTSHLVRNRLR